MQQVLPTFERKSVFVVPNILGPDWSGHCQMPTPLQLDETTLRVYFCSRDQNNHSAVFWADVDAQPPFKIKRVSKKPVLVGGKLGEFDQAGVMPTAIIRRDQEIWMYYIGWSVRHDVPYHNGIGIAKSFDNGNSFERFLEGPVVATGVSEPYFCGTADVFELDGDLSMVYMSATEWRIVNGKPEPRYNLKQVFSKDGINWDLTKPSKDRIAVDYLSEDEGGIARASVIKIDDRYYMWFCHRGLNNYRVGGDTSYRLGLATSNDGKNWTRHQSHSVFSQVSATGSFDYHMECYPFVFERLGRTYMFYNGSDFGQTGIGYAEFTEKFHG